MKKVHIVFLLLLYSMNLPAQKAPQSNGTATSFTEQQRMFDEWRRTHDISTIKGWKYYKRWEHEQLMHTNAQGEPVRAEEYLSEVMRAIAQRPTKFGSGFINEYSWTSVGPDNRPPPLYKEMQNGMGRINCMAFHPTDSNTYYIGVAQGGIWKTTDNGNTWRAMTDQLPITRVSDVVVDPSNPNIIYAAIGDFEYLQFGALIYGNKRNTYFGLGVYKSTDAGESWNPTGLSFSLTGGEASLICKVLVNSRYSNIVVAAGANGIYYSSDGGATWKQQLYLLCWDLVADPTQTNVLYTTSGYLSRPRTGYAGIWKSLDFGQTWKELGTRIPTKDSVERIKIAIAPSSPNYLYAITTNPESGLFAIYKSTNEGTTWTRKFDSLNILDWQYGTQNGGQGNYDLVLQVDAKDRNKVYAGGVNIWASTDGAATWNPVTFWTGKYGPSAHADHHFLTYRPLTKHYYLCNDGGAVRTTTLIPEHWDNLAMGAKFETEWTPVSKNMAITSFYRVSSSRTNDDRLLAGAQDNSSSYFDGKNWSGVIGGDGMDNWIDGSDPTSYIGSSQFGNFVKTIDGMNFKNLKITNQWGEWTTPIVGDYSRRGVLYTGFGDVFQSKDNGETWKAVSAFSDSLNGYLPEISAIAVTPADSAVIMVTKRVRYERKIPGHCYRTSNRGSTWNNITAGLPDSLYFTSVEISDDDANIAWVTCAGFSPGRKVFRTSNAGQTWQNISFNLPNLPVNTLKQIPGSPKHMILIGTDVGVYLTNDSLGSWLPYTNGLPNVIITDLEINSAANKIYVATFGRGIWVTDLVRDLPVISRVDELKSEKDFLLYPMPVKRSEPVTLSFSNDYVGDVYVEISDLKAKHLMHLVFKKNAWYFEQKLNLNLAAGIYYINVSSTDFCGEHALVIE